MKRIKPPSIVSSHHTRTVDDTGIQNQEYAYPGEPRVIPPSRRNTRRRSGLMMDLDEEFRSAINRARGTSIFAFTAVRFSIGGVQ